MTTSDSAKKLGWFLCWAIVFADIGTSLYYVPGILFGEVGNLAGLFVLMSSVVFVLLTLKYIEITDRYAEGGGVVTVASHAFGPWFGALGGMFIIVDYFLTASISSVSGFAYLNSILPLGSFVLIAAIIGVLALGALNVYGIKESASVTAVVATAAFIVDVLLVLFVATQIGPEGWQTVFASLGQVSRLAPWPMLTGFAGSFLAFSGLESISQLSPAMQLPRKKIAGWAMALVVVAILLTSPFLTLFSTNLLTAKVPDGSETILESVSAVKDRETQLITVTDGEEKEVLSAQIEQGKKYSERFMSELGAQYGGPLLKVAVVATASILLLFASNTAIIGAYHVFISLSRQRFLPKILLDHNRRFDTPHWAVMLAILPPIIIIWMTQGDLNLLGQLYAFGLLGAFALSSVGLDVVRWRENKKISPMFLLGILTSLLVVVAWGTNLYSKQLATMFGGGITIFGMLTAFVVRKLSSEETVGIKVEEVAPIPKEQIFAPVFDEYDPKLFEYVAHYAKHTGKQAIIVYIREFSDVLQYVPETIADDKEAQRFLANAGKIMENDQVTAHLLYRTAVDTGEEINKLRKELDPAVTILSPERRSRIEEFLHGDIVQKVLKHKDGHVLIYTGMH